MGRHYGDKVPPLTIGGEVLEEECEYCKGTGYCSFCNGRGNTINQKGMDLLSFIQDHLNPSSRGGWGND